MSPHSINSAINTRNAFLKSLEEKFMAKGQDSKKAVKKKSEKTLKEKRMEKKLKKANKQ